ncbi:MAG: cellulase family glycosylhydrolase [Chitinispirillia bacterium]|nr:cellulase family glycosylhydrolase [Chitinispirillia bacterium]MCL2241053.1 cellulase family glycosylhydrolase [Chitinispirillia bacterium]
MKSPIVRRPPALIALILFLAVSGELSAQAPAGSPVDRHGQLKVSGSQILDKNDQPVQLRGMSLYWSMGPGAGAFYNADVVKYLRDDWNASLIRAAMGVNDRWGVTQAGYLNGDNSAGVSNKVRVTDVVDGAIEHGMYVIIDWHSHKADSLRPQTIEFFEEMARAYKQYPNVIYEIFNEPTNQSWASVIKPFSQAVVDAIRAIDPNNLILIGTRQWCQRPDEAAADPVNGENLAYVMHFYAGSHNTVIRNNTFRALRMGKAVFVSEFGTVNSDGAGAPNLTESDRWMDFMDQFKLSWANWSLSNMSETSAALTGASTTPGVGGAVWANANLTVSGEYIRGRLRNPPGAEKKFTTLTTDITGQGTVTPVNSANQVFYQGSAAVNVGLKATPAPGWKFDGWSGDVTAVGSDSARVTMDGTADKVAKATFSNPTSVLSGGAAGKAHSWSVRSAGGALCLRGPVQGGAADVVIYDTRGKVVRKVTAAPGASVGNIRVPAGNYVVTVRDRASGRQVYRARALMVN